MSKIVIASLMITVALLFSFCQVFLKRFSAALERELASGEFGILRLVAVSINFDLIIGIVLGGTASSLYVYALTKAPLSFLFPFYSLTFPLVLLFGWFFFGEHVSWPEITGVAFIVMGLIIMATQFDA